jgi:hypothetical protein
VLLSTPVAIFGAFFVLWLRRTILAAFLPSYMVQIESDVYSQIGLVMLIGLAAKNAILIVEFAKEQYEQGKPLAEAALEGARLRLRPILMTSFAFILGAVPLWTASGAGAVARQIMGTAVIGGMLGASLFGIFFTTRQFRAWDPSQRPRPRGSTQRLPQTVSCRNACEPERACSARGMLRFGTLTWASYASIAFNTTNWNAGGLGAGRRRSTYYNPSKR